MEDKLLKELFDERIRLRHSKITSVMPDYSGLLVSGSYSSGVEPISSDYASLYPHTMRFGGKKIIRKRKIKKIFTDI
jgi:hypothetical protein